MIDFVGRTTSPLDAMQQWNQYFTADEAAAQAAWQNRELRNRYNEAALYNREGAASDAQAYNGAGITSDMQDMNTQLAGLRPQNVDPAHVGNAVDGAAANAPIRGRYANNPTTTNNTPSVALRDDEIVSPGGIPQSRLRTDQRTIRPVSPQQLTPDQRQAWATYLATRGYTDQASIYDGAALAVQRSPRGQERPAAEQNAAMREMTRLGIGVRNGHLVTLYRSQSNRMLDTSALTGSNSSAPSTNTPSATAAIPPAPTAGDVPGSATTANAGAPAALSDDPNNDVNPGGLEPPDAYQGTNDTSRSLQPTREMRMIQSRTQDALRRADIAARHGDRAGAAAAFAEGLQGQAAYLQMYRGQMYRAASAGSNDALATLLAEFSGYPNHTARLQPTDERRTRFNLQIQLDDGRWVTANETPHTRNEMLAGVQDLVDAEGAAARTEANDALIRAQIAAGAQIRVADINMRSQYLQSLSQIEIARLNNEARAALEDGRGDLLMNSQDGSVWLRYSTRDAQGNRVQNTVRMANQNVQTPGVDGNRTTQAPVATRVTGINGVTAQGGNQ